MDSAVDDNSSCNGSSSRSISDFDDDGVQPPLPKLPVLEVEPKPRKTETETRRCTARVSRKTLWESDYFFIPQPPPGCRGLRIHARNCVKESGLGVENLSKQMTPAHFGESTETPGSCTVTILLLRAWSIWRAHRHDWPSAKASRKRSIDEDLCLLKRDVEKVLSQNGGSLGNRNADAVWAKFQEECPELAQ